MTQFNLSLNENQLRRIIKALDTQKSYEYKNARIQRNIHNFYLAEAYEASAEDTQKLTDLCEDCLYNTIGKELLQDT